MSETIGAYIRAHKDRLVALWKDDVLRTVPALHALSEASLLDHILEFLDGLAAWADGQTEEASQAFEALVEGHAMQRLGYGVGLEVVAREYSRLRMVLLGELLPFTTGAAQREQLRHLDEGIDRATSEAIRRYAQRRELVRDRFIGILGHDLRDPLGAVSLGAAMLVDDLELAPPHRKQVERIQRAAGRMDRMVKDILDFARAQLGDGIPTELAPVDMAEVCRAVADEAGVPARLSVALTGDLRGAFDRERVHQALGNLVRNALQHGAGTVELRAVEADDQEAIITSVANAGPEIPLADRARMFDAFRGTRSRDGVGLGLFIVQQIALTHGGRCTVTCENGQTIFAIRWPRASARLQQPNLGVEIGSADHASTKPASWLRGPAAQASRSSESTAEVSLPGGRGPRRGL